MSSEKHGKTDIPKWNIKKATQRKAGSWFQIENSRAFFKNAI
jgi:hypothetical protein